MTDMPNTIYYLVSLVLTFILGLGLGQLFVTMYSKTKYDKQHTTLNEINHEDLILQERILLLEIEKLKLEMKQQSKKNETVD